MTRSDALRELYEALEMLDTRQRRTDRPTRAAQELVIDLRDLTGPAFAPGSPGPVRVTLGTDWVRDDRR